jgi:hypothetical protein
MQAQSGLDDDLQKAVAQALEAERSARDGHLARAGRVIERVRAGTGRSLDIKEVQGWIHALDEGRGRADDHDLGEDGYDPEDAMIARIDAAGGRARRTHK